METTAVTHTGCCDPFDPTPWRDSERVWTDKLFVKDRVRSFFHVPLNMGSVITGVMAKIRAADAEAAPSLMLCDENSLWGSDVYIEATKDVPGATMATLSGTFRTRVFEGPYSMAGRWAKEMHEVAAARGTSIKKLYFNYTTCPRCAAAYGKNYTVLFAQIA